MRASIQAEDKITVSENDAQFSSTHFAQPPTIHELPQVMVATSQHGIIMKKTKDH